MRLTPRDRALAALEVIDRHHMAIERRTGAVTPRTNPAVDRAYRELGTAMDSLYGELPPETRYERQGRLRASDTRSQDL